MLVSFLYGVGVGVGVGVLVDVAVGVGVTITANTTTDLVPSLLSCSFRFGLLPVSESLLSPGIRTLSAAKVAAIAKMAPRVTAIKVLIGFFMLLFFSVWCWRRRNVTDGVALVVDSLDEVAASHKANNEEYSADALQYV